MMNVEDPTVAIPATNFKELFLSTSIAKSAWGRLEEIHKDHLRTGASRGFLMLGPSGVGKSALVKRYAASVNRGRALSGEVLPVLYWEMPSSPTRKNLSSALLKGLGESRSEDRTQSAELLWHRVITLLQSLKTELIIIDEAQHLVDYKKNKYEAGDWLKSLINTSSATVVMVGMDRVTEIKEENTQFRRRFSAEFWFERFQPGTQLWSEFGSVIKTLQSYVSVRRIDLVTPDTIQRFYFATHGLLDYLIKIIDRVVQLVVTGRYPCVDLAALEQAFMDEVWARAKPQRNPFHSSFDLKPLVQHGEPFAKVESRNQ